MHRRIYFFMGKKMTIYLSDEDYNWIKSLPKSFSFSKQIRLILQFLKTGGTLTNEQYISDIVHYYMENIKDE